MSGIPPVHPIEADAWKSTFRASALVQEELFQVREACTAALETLTQSEEELLLRLQEITQSKNELKSRLQRIDAATSPHRKLPPELLSKIFELTREHELLLPPEDPEAARFSPFRMKPQCYLRSVCSFWRQVAQQTPLLAKDVWKVVTINYRRLFSGADYHGGVGAPSSAYQLAQYARDIILRGTHTLSINFGQWDELEDGIQGDMLLEITVGAGMTQLQRVIVDNLSVSQPFVNRCATLLASFPQLESIVINYWSSDTLPFPLHQNPIRNLTEFELTRYECAPIAISDSEFYQLLAWSPQLKTCNVQISCKDHLSVDFEPPGGLLRHESLSTLTLYRECYGLSDPCKKQSVPFRHLELPSLRNLTFKIYGISERGHGPTLFDAIKQSRFGLEHLKLFYDDDDQPWLPISVGEWQGLASVLHRLTYLSVPWLLPTAAFQEIIQGSCLPHIRHLCCGVRAVDQHYQLRLQELLDSRYGVGRFSPEVTLRLVTDDEIAELEAGSLTP